MKSKLINDRNTNKKSIVNNASPNKDFQENVVYFDDSHLQNIRNDLSETLRQKDKFNESKKLKVILQTIKILSQFVKE